jgi:hypothetical protein
LQNAGAGLLFVSQAFVCCRVSKVTRASRLRDE